ncbi:GuaB3 family IMP dehydrogenase-related protein [bacterium]|nr:GuaB3 family IMP dehydrogenase-related protein [bacterium]
MSVSEHLHTLSPTYGFDDVSILPGLSTLDPKDVDMTTSIGDISLRIPILASAMDSAVDPSFAGRVCAQGALAVLNLEGLQTKYVDPSEALAEISSASTSKVVPTIQRLYKAPIQDHLVAQRINEMKESGAIAAVSVTPAAASRLGPLAVDAGAEIIFVQATVISPQHRGEVSLDLTRFVKDMDLPVVLGNCVTGDVALALMETGAAGLLVGVGPGAACTTRAVTGVGVGQVTATMSCALARDAYQKETGRRVAIITDGGMRKGGEIAKAIASGADGVMLGSVFSGLRETPGEGFHWGMATQDAQLPRGTRVTVKSMVDLETLFFGPSHKDDGTLNLIGGLSNSMGMVGAATISQMQRAQVVHCPSLKDEGKHYQFREGIGQGA